MVSIVLGAKNHVIQYIPYICLKQSVICELSMVVMVIGIFTSLVIVLERMVPSPEDSSRPSPMATSLLQIITSLITNDNQKYIQISCDYNHVILLYRILQSFITTVMARPLTTHVIHLIIPAVKSYVPVNNVISAVMVTSQDHKIVFPLDTLYCLLSVVQGGMGMCTCVCVRVRVCVCEEVYTSCMHGT